MDPSVAVVGATGAVGELMRQVLVERDFPARAVKFLASPKSAGKTVEFRGRTYPIEPLRPEAFQGVDIVLERGGVFGVLGPNGSGKSTTVRMLLGLARPDRGTVKLFGRPLREDISGILGRIGAV